MLLSSYRKKSANLVISDTETKKDLAEQVIGGETGQLGSLSKEELLELLGV